MAKVTKTESIKSKPVIKRGALFQGTVSEDYYIATGPSFEGDVPCIRIKDGVFDRIPTLNAAVLNAGETLLLTQE